MSYKFGATTGSDGNLNFGGAASNTPKSSAGGSLSGSTTATSGASSTTLFGGGTTGTASFGAQKPGGTGLFGGAGGASNTDASKPSGISFGTGAGNTQNQSPFNFGNAASTSTTTGGSMFGAGTPNTTGSFSFGQSKADGAATTSGQENKPATPTGNIFGGLNKPAAGVVFGTPGTSAPASFAPGSTTPAPAKNISNFASTTPAGPPPMNPSASTGNLFSSQQQSAVNLFGAPKTTASTQPAQTPATTTSSTLLFSSTPATAPMSTLFGGAKTPALGGANSIFGQKPSTPATVTAGNSTPTTSTSTEATKPALSFTFPAASGAPSTQASSTPAPTSTSFGKLTTTTSAPSSSAPAQTPSPFGIITSSAAASSSTPAPATTAPSIGGLFGPKSSETSTSGATTTSATAPATSTATASSNINQQTGTGALGGNAGGATASGLGASQAGPSPQLSRLKNKTMDEIITRWASDLSKYQKEFQEQATKVAQWDRLLVENGEKIQKLYNSTWEAERASAEVERQLSTVESQQDELSAWLDRYEAEIDDMFTAQVGEVLQGPDHERETTYKMAEKLSDRLDEMGKDLTHMIDAMNEASATLNKSNKSDDPLSHIVRVLNSHLMQLQWIDQNAKLLQEKVEAAQKLGQSLGQNGFSGPDTDAAEHFYRSFMGRR